MSHQKWLIITEKPSVAADIAKALGGFEKKPEYYTSEEYEITWAIGHIMELLEPEEIDPKYKRWLLQDLPILPDHFEYKPKKGQSERIGQIKQLAKKPQIVGFINACDAGREGELIFREIYDYCGQAKPVKRLWLQSMTMTAIKKEFQALKPGQDYDNLGDAARCRSESDWLIGMNGTRAITKRLKTKNTKGVWSVGRVQTPTLALLVKRELEHLKHRPRPYFTIEGRFSTPSHEYSGVWFDPTFKKQAGEDPETQWDNEKEDRIFSTEKLKEIREDCEKHKSKASAQETRKEAKEIAPQLFDLTLLQRECNRKFGLSASRTLQAAQRLYEKYKLLTYPRTDSRYLPEDYVEHVKNVLREFSAVPSELAPLCKRILKNGLLNKDRVFDDKRVSDHFAIIPTGQFPSEKLDGDDARVFQLVLKRFLAAFMPHAVWAKVERISKIGSQNFRTRVQDLQEPGWREVYGLDTEEESRLPKLNPADPQANTPVTVAFVQEHEESTKPPPRFTEAKLLSLMEHCGRSISDEDFADALKDKGIGTPATRADIIENIISKEYVVRFGKTLRATSKSIRLMDVLSRIPVENLTKVELTGEMEYELKLMEKGKKKRTDFMVNMYNFTRTVVDKVRSFEYEMLYQHESPLGPCPVCKKGQILEGFWGYKCSRNNNEKSNTEDSCNFIIWKEKNLRYIDRTIVTDVMEKKVAGPFEFSNLSGTSIFEEYLTISPEKGLVFCDVQGHIKENTSSAGASVLHEEFLPETFLKKPGLLKITENAYLCEFDPVQTNTQDTSDTSKKSSGDKAPKKKAAAKPKTTKSRKTVSRMPKELCGRPMSLDEYKEFVTTGSTPPILDFKSKKGRIFAAVLKLKENGNFEFKFISRKSLEAPSTAAGGTEKAAKPPKKARSATKAKVIKKDL